MPEWKVAFVHYWQLKKDLKRMQLLATAQQAMQQPSPLACRLLSPLKKFPLFGSHTRKDHGIIQVHKKLASSASKGDLYETEMLEKFADTDTTREFFHMLDLLLNKVNQFYRGKEKEFMEKGEGGVTEEAVAKLGELRHHRRGYNSRRRAPRQDLGMSDR